MSVQRSRRAAAEPRRRLGAALRAARLSAGLTTRQLPGFSTSHVSNVETGHALPSEAMVKAYADLGGDLGELLVLLEKARRAKYGDDPLGLDALLADPHTDPAILRRGYAIDAGHDSHFLGAARQPLRNVHSVTVRALSSGARYFPFRHAHEDDLRRGVCTVEPQSGCSLALTEESETGTVYAVLDFGAARERDGEACTFSWTITLHSDVPVRPQVVSGTRTLLRRSTHEVSFSQPAVPRVLWWFRSFDSREGMMTPPPERILEPSPEHVYRQDFAELHEEWWGLAWSWA